MKKLFIDTHLFDINMFLFEDDKILKEEHVVGHKYNSTFLIPTLEKLYKNETIDEIIVCNGPGSFTGVRLGVTIAKTLAYTLNIPIKTITYLDMMALSTNKDNGIVAFSDGNGYFVEKFNFINKENKLDYISNKEFENYKQNNEIKTDVSINYDKVIHYCDVIKPTLSHAVNPIYIKSIGVENDKKN